jgi:hypothetical protein
VHSTSCCCHDWKASSVSAVAVWKNTAERTSNLTSSISPMPVQIRKRWVCHMLQVPLRATQGSVSDSSVPSKHRCSRADLPGRSEHATKGGTLSICLLHVPLLIAVLRGCCSVCAWSRPFGSTCLCVYLPISHSVAGMPHIYPAKRQPGTLVCWGGSASCVKERVESNWD